jgi:flagellar export protein FliJ
VKFRFRAAPLLTLRQRQLDAAQLRLAHANEDVASSERLADAAAQAVAHADSAYREALANAADNAVLERHRIWISRQCSYADARQRARAECRGVAAAAASNVLATHRQVRVLERLRERARRRFDAEIAAREMKEIDLLATLQYARRMSEGGPR